MNVRRVWIFSLSQLLVAGVVACGQPMEPGPQQPGNAGVGGEPVSDMPGALDTGVVLVQVLSALIIQSPVLLVMVVGAVVAITRWRRHPTVSALALSAMLIAALALLTGPIISGVLCTVMGWRVLICELVTATPYAVVWGLLLAAVFGWRPIS